MNKRKIINDPVYGFLTILTDLIFDLIGHPFFQRLRRIKQLGLTHYVYPGALHTRFHHALGAMHLMGLAIQTLRSKGNRISDEEAEAASVAILLHDTGHGPYSHALEHTLIDMSHEALTLEFMHALNETFDGRLGMAIAMFTGAYPRKFFHQLIAGQLDMDRMDYLRRDSFFTGVAEGVIGTDRLIAMLDIVDDRVVLEEKGLFSIEHFLVARRIMYWQVYLHKTVIAAEQMLRQAVSLMAEVHAGITSPPLQTLLHHKMAEEPIQGKTLAAFAMIDDIDIGYAIKQLADTTDPVLQILAGGLVNRMLFRTKFSGVPVPEETTARVAGQLAKSMHLTAAQAAQLVLTGMESIPTYEPGDDEIRVLRKDGSVAPLSEVMAGQIETLPRHRYFLCYPKEAGSFSSVG